LLSLAALVTGSPLAQVTFQHSKSVKGAIASESKVCSQIGIDLLERGVSTFLPPLANSQTCNSKFRVRGMQQMRLLEPSYASVLSGCITLVLVAAASCSFAIRMAIMSPSITEKRLPLRRTGICFKGTSTGAYLEACPLVCLVSCGGWSMCIRNMA
jgi:hypothetical protein